jgi:hypothetical protein
MVFFLFCLWGCWHCGHSWPIMPASGDSEDDCGEADGMQIDREHRCSRRKPAPAPLLSITKSHMTRQMVLPVIGCGMGWIWRPMSACIFLYQEDSFPLCYDTHSKWLHLSDKIASFHQYNYTFRRYLVSLLRISYCKPHLLRRSERLSPYHSPLQRLLVW